MINDPVLWLIAGPNGVGKTTYAFRHIRTVSGSAHFVNLDEIARGLSPLAPEMQGQRAARTALALTRALIAGGQTFSIETTLAGRTHLRTIEAARHAGFAINLLFFALPSADTALTRIARRVSEGGHNVPEADVRRRFERAMANFTAYAEAADLWRVFDNSGFKPAVLAEGCGGCISSLGDLAPAPADLAVQLSAMRPCPTS